MSADVNVVRNKGKEDPTTDVINVWEEGGANSNDSDVNDGKGGNSLFVHRLSPSSASEFGRSDPDEHHPDKHLHEEDDEEGHHHHHHHHGGMNNFFHRAFHGGRSHSSGFSGPFGFGGASSSSGGGGGGGFRYYSSSSSSGGGSHRSGGPVYGDEDGHNDVQCQQM